MKITYAPKGTATRGHVVPINRIEMYYEEYGVGKPLVLLHGFGGCAQNWHPFIAKLSEHRRLIVVDLRGHGYSTNPENKFTHREAARDGTSGRGQTAGYGVGREYSRNENITPIKQAAVNPRPHGLTPFRRSLMRGGNRPTCLGRFLPTLRCPDRRLLAVLTPYADQ